MIASSACQRSADSIAWHKSRALVAREAPIALQWPERSARRIGSAAFADGLPSAAALPAHQRSFESTRRQRLQRKATLRLRVVAVPKAPVGAWRAEAVGSSSQRGIGATEAHRLIAACRVVYAAKARSARAAASQRCGGGADHVLPISVTRFAIDTGHLAGRARRIGGLASRVRIKDRCE